MQALTENSIDLAGSGAKSRLFFHFQCREGVCGRGPSLLIVLILDARSGRRLGIALADFASDRTRFDAGRNGRHHFALSRRE